MKPDRDDEQLRLMLRRHLQPTGRRTPDFRAKVWRHIEERRRESGSWMAWLKAHAVGMTAYAVACIAVAVVTGGVLANSQTQDNRDDLLQRYIQSIDPIHRTVAMQNPGAHR